MTITHVIHIKKIRCFIELWRTSGCEKIQTHSYKL